MRLRTNQTGFSAVEILIVAVVLGLIGFVSYTFYTRQNDKTADTITTSRDVPAVPEITSTSDLDKASVMLDEADTDSSADSAKLDSQLQTF